MGPWLTSAPGWDLSTPSPGASRYAIHRRGRAVRVGHDCSTAPEGGVDTGAEEARGARGHLEEDDLARVQRRRVGRRAAGADLRVSGWIREVAGRTHRGAVRVRVQGGDGDGGRSGHRLHVLVRER